MNISDVITLGRCCEVLVSGRFDRLTVAHARALIESDADLSRTPVTRRLYFGCGRDIGHYFWGPGMLKDLGYREIVSILPWKHIDGVLNPKKQVQGEAYIHHLGGWTAIAFADRSVDTRHGSNSAFFFDSRLNFTEALADARKHFPEVFARISFQIVLVEPPQVLR